MANTALEEGRVTRRRAVQTAAGLSLMTAGVGPGHTANNGYPARSVTCIVGFPAGGSVDYVARLIGERLSARIGQPFVVENRPGAGGNLAATAAAKAPSSGYTLFVCSSANAVSPYLYKSLQYHPTRDFVYIARWITTSYMVVVNALHDTRSLATLLEHARRNPGKVTLGTQGAGTPPHLAGALLSSRANVDLLQVPFKGGNETMTALLSGIVDFTFAPIPLALPHVQSGKLRVLAMTSARRSALQPEIATVAEQGFPGFEVGFWYGLAAPAGTPDGVVTMLGTHSEAILADPEVREKLALQGMEPAPMKGKEFAAFFASQEIFYKRLVADAKIEPL